jgi:hypothetical protein
MAVGGFIGSDPILTTDRLEKMVVNGEVRYFLTMGGPGDLSGNTTGNGSFPGGMPGMMGGQSEITSWVKAHGKLIPSSEWTGESGGDSTGGMGMGGGFGMSQLYDLKGGQ